MKLRKIIAVGMTALMLTVVAADAKPPDKPPGQEKCHPVKGCPDPEPSPSPTPSPTPSPSPSPKPSPSPPPSPGEWNFQDIVNPAVTNPEGVSQTIASDGNNAVSLYKGKFQRDIWLRIVSGDTVVDKQLPDDGHGQWQNIQVVLRGNNLWTLSGIGPVALRQFDISGAVTQKNIFLYGDSNSRPGAINKLTDGIVAVWHQATFSPGNGLGVVTHRAGVNETFVGSVSTRSSRQVVAQHTDGTIWIFSNNDASGVISRIRLSTGLSLLNNNYEFIGSQHGEFDADPERPSLTLTSDGDELVLAYQSAKRVWSSDGIRSWPGVAWVKPDGTIRFKHLPIYVERIDQLGLSYDGNLWMFYRPFPEGVSHPNRLDVARLSGDNWEVTQLSQLGNTGNQSFWGSYDPHHASVVFLNSNNVLRWGRN